MAFSTGKEATNINKKIAKELKKRQGVDLIFVEDLIFNNGLFTGYTQNGIPFFGEHVVKDVDYYFGFFNQKGERYLYGTLVKKEDGDDIYYLGSMPGYCALYKKRVVEEGFYKKPNKFKTLFYSKEIEINPLFIQPVKGALKMVMPDIKNPQFHQYKADRKRFYFGEMRDGNPCGYGLNVNLSLSRDITFAYFTDWVDNDTSKIYIALRDDNLLLSTGEKTIEVSDTGLCLGITYEGTKNIYSSYSNRSQKRAFEYRAYDIDSSYKETLFDSEGNAIIQKEGKKYIAEPFYMRHKLFPVQYAFAFLGNLLMGDYSQIHAIYNLVPNDLKIISNADLENIFSCGHNIFDKYIKDVEAQIALEKAEKKKKKENKI